jgi:hypothetical protein
MPPAAYLPGVTFAPVRSQRAEPAERGEVIEILNRALDQGDLPLADYDHRIAAVGSATYTSELVAQLGDLPAEYAWLPVTALAPPPPPALGRSGRAALILGIVSLPTSFCIVGAVFGIAAVVLSLRAERRPGLSPAMLGRVFGIVGVALSIAALAALVFALNSPAGP